MDPLILNKLNSKVKKVRQLGYNQKADIWSLGSICYKMIIGKAAFDAKDMADLVNKIETGKYKVPRTLSKEVISFLNGMLQYNSNDTLDINQLANHPFIIKNVKEFHSISLRQVSNKLDDTKRNIVIDVKKNSSIWAKFNKEDEDKLINISPGYLTPQPHKKCSQEIKPKIQMKEDDNPIKQINTFHMKEINMNNINNMNIFNQCYNNYHNYNYNNTSNEYYGHILTDPIQGIPSNPIYQNNNMTKIQFDMEGVTISSASTTESQYSYSGGIYN